MTVLALVLAAALGTPRAIVSLSPSVTDVLHAIGAFESVVAVSDHCDLPRGESPRPRVGGWLDVRLEPIASLEPDLVILSELQEGAVLEPLAALGIQTLVVPGQSLDDVFTAIRAIGRAVGRLERAERLIRETREGLDEIRARTEGARRPRVLTVVDRAPGTLRDLYVATRGSFLIEIVRIAGGEPILPPAALGWVKLGAEALVALDPEVVLDVVPAAARPPMLLSARLAEDPLAVWRDLPQVSAVREGRVYVLSDPSLVHPSQRVVEAARHVARLLHPERLDD